MGLAVGAVVVGVHQERPVYLRLRDFIAAMILGEPTHPIQLAGAALVLDETFVTLNGGERANVRFARNTANFYTIG